MTGVQTCALPISDAKDRQAKNRTKSMTKKVAEAESDSARPESDSTPVRPESDSATRDPNPNDGDAPSREEIEAAEEAHKADQKMMYEILEADDKLKVAMEENKRLNLRVAQLEARLRGLMNERNEAVKMVKSLQKQIDKSKAKK